MPQPQLGSFAAGSPEVQEAVRAAIARRQGGQAPVAQLGQTGQAPPTVTPPVPQGAPSAVPQGAQAAPTPPPSEAEIIEKALAQRLSSISKVEIAQAVPPAPRQSPQQAPVGGGSVR